MRTGYLVTSKSYSIRKLRVFPSANRGRRSKDDEITGAMTQQTKRYLSIIILFAVGGYFVWVGEGWRIAGAPAQWAGYIFAAIGAAGLLGFNIWFGGPLDKRGDAEHKGKSAPPESAPRD